MAREAACSCGQLRVSAEGDPIRISVCHCLACQRRTGSAFGVQARFPADRVQVTGRATEFVRVSDEGDERTFRFCPDCGATVFYTLASAPDAIAVPVGAFADPSFPAPRISVWEERQHPWLSLSLTSAASRHISERIARPAAEVYEYAADPANVPEWAPGLGTAVECVDGRWYVETSTGRAGLAFAERNELGVLDHEVTLPSGEVVYVPMRVLPDGDGCEVVFTLWRLPGMSDEEFGRDAGLVAADLARLKRIVEERA